MFCVALMNFFARGEFGFFCGSFAGHFASVSLYLMAPVVCVLADGCERTPHSPTGGRARHWGTLRVGRLSSGRMTSGLFFVPRHDVLWRCYMCVGVGVEGGDSVFFGLRHLRKAAPLTLPPDAVCPGLLGWKQDRG